VKNIWCVMECVLLFLVDEYLQLKADLVDSDVFWRKMFWLCTLKCIRFIFWAKNTLYVATISTL